ncbi:MAG TPA: TonB-dependent receptor [Gemmatimonadales bacterium]
MAALGAQQRDTLPRDTTTLAPVVVTATRLRSVHEVMRGLTGRTATLQGPDLDARGVRTLAEALEELPGVTTSDELGSPSQLDVTLRGFQVSPTIGMPQGITVYVDGVRVNEPDANEVNFDLLPLEDVERVEVVYGPSVLLGRNALGAAVNLVTRRGGEPATHALEVSGGSFERFELKLQAGGRSNVWDYYIGGRYEDEDGWRQATDSRIATLFGKIGFTKGGWDATLSYSGAHHRVLQAGSLPEDVVRSRPDSNFTPGDYFAPTSHLVTLNAERQLGAVSLDVNLFGRSLGTDQFNGNVAPPDARERNHERIGGGAIQLAGSAQLLGRALHWLAGLDGSYSHTIVTLHAVRPGRPDSLTDSIQSNEGDAGVFAGMSYDLLPALTATLLGRYDDIQLPFDDLDDPSESGANRYRRFSPRAALTWRGLESQELYASISRAFRPAALVEIACSDPATACALPFALGPDPALRPVVATSYEVGWRGGLPETGVTFAADAFRTDVRDDIFFVAPTATTGFFQNIGSTRRQGFEASVRWVTSGGAMVYANYGRTVATFQTAAVLSTGRAPGNETVAPGDLVPMVPADRINAGASFPLVKDAVRLRIDARYIGRQFLRGDEANVTPRLPDYTVADASFELDLGRYQARVMVPNVFDHHYVSFGTFAQNPTVAGSPVQRFLTPGQPRQLLASLSYDF